MLIRVGQGSLRAAGSARQAHVHGHDPARRPGGHPDSALSGAGPPREAGTGVRRSLAVALDALHVARQRRLAAVSGPEQPARRPSTRLRAPSPAPRGPPSAAIGPASAAICPSTPACRVAHSPNSAAGSPIGSPISPAQRSGPALPWPDTSSWPAQRSSGVGCDTPSAPRTPRAGGRWRGVNAVCGGKREAPRDPRHPTPPPLSVPGAPSEGGGTLTAPLRVPFQIQGVQGQKKSGKSWGEVRQGPGSRGRTDGESAGMDHSTCILTIPGPAVKGGIRAPLSTTHRRRNAQVGRHPARSAPMRSAWPSAMPWGGRPTVTSRPANPARALPASLATRFATPEAASARLRPGRAPIRRPDPLIAASIRPHAPVDGRSAAQRGPLSLSQAAHGGSAPGLARPCRRPVGPPSGLSRWCL